MSPQNGHSNIVPSPNLFPHLGHAISVALTLNPQNGHPNKSLESEAIATLPPLTLSTWRKNAFGISSTCRDSLQVQDCIQKVIYRHPLMFMGDVIPRSRTRMYMIRGPHRRCLGYLNDSNSEACHGWLGACCVVLRAQLMRCADRRRTLGQSSRPDL